MSMYQLGVFNAPVRNIRARPVESNMSHGVDRNLSDFGKYTMALAQRLEEDPHLGVIEQVFIENHIHIIQSAYGSWKRRRHTKASGE